jgi:hypothetical protein
MTKMTFADLQKIYAAMGQPDIKPLPSGMFLAIVDNKDVVPAESFISGPYLPDQGDYRHVGDIEKYHIFVPL